MALLLGVVGLDVDPASGRGGGGVFACGKRDAQSEELPLRAVAGGVDVVGGVVAGAQSLGSILGLMVPDDVLLILFSDVVIVNGCIEEVVSHNVRTLMPGAVDTSTGIRIGFASGTTSSSGSEGPSSPCALVCMGDEGACGATDVSIFTFEAEKQEDSSCGSTFIVKLENDDDRLE